MKFSKIVICFSCLFPSILLSSPLDHPEHHDLKHCEKSNGCPPPNISHTYYNDIKEITWDLAHLSKDVDNIKSDVYSQLQTIEKILNDFSSKIAHQNSKSTENAEGLSELALYTTDEIALLSSKLSLQNTAHLKQTKQLGNQLQALHQNIYRLDKKMNAGFASQAALSGLFQPDANNTVNFTASVGGYHTQVALAVGMGYRFSKNVATRAGIAVNPNSRLTYNTAINFAW
ncbi:YadA-like family protein [Pasteurella canis]|uniref:YadA C-terminal domain-containing protein n=1 Tax=Pasteurella canis TaxID=753 RepID=UPI001CC4885C|nr:YadA C-terminal domain-containing protein [Pasteurella canis]UAY77454.1 YadA-like family protein [Pasteurella canis]